MADKRLSELTELAATPTDNDEVYICDVSEAAADKSKRITIANLLSYSVDSNGIITFGSKIMADGIGLGLDVLYSGIIGAHLTVGNNITVGGTVDGVDIAARDHAESHTLASHSTKDNTMFANVQITGGGVITWSGTHLLWTTRLIAIPVEKVEFSSDGFINMDCPTSGTVVYYPEGGGTSTVACTADGIPIGAWEALYYRFVRGSASGSDRTRFCVVHYKNADWSPDDGWILVATRNGDATCESVKVAVGVTFPVTGGVYDVDAVLSDWVSADAVAAVEAAGLTFAENKGIILDALLSADEKWSGISEIGTMGYNATAGDLVYLAVADTKWELAKADVASTSKGKIGLATVTTSVNNTCQVLLYGKMRSAAFPAFTVGAPVHVSAATAGDMAVAAPTGTTNFVVRIIGYGNTAEDLFFCPDNTYIELA